jgi:membrane protein
MTDTTAPDRTARPAGRPDPEPAADRGRDADAPSEIPARGWKDIAVRVKREAEDDNLSLVAAGVAFFALLSVVPAMVAAISLYGLVASPEDVARHIDDLSGAMPEEARTLVGDQLDQVVSASEAGLSVGLIGGLVIALWGASTAMKHLVVALSTVYDEHDDRGFLKLRARALLLTLAGIAFLGVAVLLLTVAPAWLGGDDNEVVRVAVSLLRWPLLLAMMMVGLAVLYRHAPDRAEPRWQWVSWGAAVATVAWLLASVGFSLYASYLGSYNETYGSMAGIVVLMLWLFLTALCVLVGAEVNAEIEHQTAEDSTTGPPRPLGSRDAYVADTLGAPAD